MLFGQRRHFAGDKIFQRTGQIFEVGQVRSAESGLRRLLVGEPRFPFLKHSLDFTGAWLFIRFFDKIADIDGESVCHRASIQPQEKFPLLGWWHDRLAFDRQSGQNFSLVRLGQQLSAKLFVKVELSQLVSGRRLQHAIDFGIGQTSIGKRGQPTADRGIVEVQTRFFRFGGVHHRSHALFVARIGIDSEAFDAILLGVVTETGNFGRTAASDRGLGQLGQELDGGVMRPRKVADLVDVVLAAIKAGQLRVAAAHHPSPLLVHGDRGQNDERKKRQQGQEHHQWFEVAAEQLEGAAAHISPLGVRRWDVGQRPASWVKGYVLGGLAIKCLDKSEIASNALDTNAPPRPIRKTNARQNRGSSRIDELGGLSRHLRDLCQRRNPHPQQLIHTVFCGKRTLWRNQPERVW